MIAGHEIIDRNNSTLCLITQHTRAADSGQGRLRQVTTTGKT